MPKLPFSLAHARTHEDKNGNTFNTFNTFNTKDIKGVKGVKGDAVLKDAAEPAQIESRGTSPAKVEQSPAPNVPGLQWDEENGRWSRYSASGGARWIMPTPDTLPAYRAYRARQQAEQSEFEAIEV
jgi:hypothetical protein